MAQIDILRDVLSYSLRKFEHCIIGSNVYFIFNNERYAIGKLRKVETRNEYNGVTIVYVSKLFGIIDECDIFFKDVFIDQKRATINVNIATDEYEWFESRYPSNRDLNRLAQHVERYINIIGDFGEDTFDYVNVSALAAQAALSGISTQMEREEESRKSLSFDSTVLIESAGDPEENEEPEQVEDEVQEIQNDEDETETEEDNTPDEEIPSKESRKSIFGFFKVCKDPEPEVILQDMPDDRVIETVRNPVSFWNAGVSDNIRAELFEIEKNRYSLEFTGTGTMKDFKVVPWEKYRESICEVHIADGILNIGNKAFKSFPLLKKVDIPDSVQIIGMSAFEFCEQLSEVRWPASLKVIGHFAFAGTQALKEVVLPDSVKEIKDYAFDIEGNLKISCRKPSSLILGEGISQSDLNDLTPVKKPSEDMYI